MLVVQGKLYVKNLGEFLKKYGSDAVFLSAEYIVNEDHAYFAAKKAVKAWEEGRNVAKTLPLEVMLYAAATRQIRDALSLGVREGENKVVAVFLNNSNVSNVEVENFVEEKVLEEDVLQMDEEKFERIVKFFKINSRELEVAGREKLPLLVRERIVLFDINK